MTVGSVPPRPYDAGPGTAPAEQAAVRGEERLLRRVLGLRPVAEQRVAERRDETSVACVQLFGPRDGRPCVGAAVGTEGLSQPSAGAGRVLGCALMVIGIGLVSLF